MTVSISNKEKIREIYQVLPKLNCGLCGYGNCGQFARAVAERRASPFGCRQNPSAGYKISEIIGAEAAAYTYGSQSAATPRIKPSPPAKSLKTLREEVKGLTHSVDDVLARIENLKAKRQNGEKGRS
ncbi:MAG: (Fe-S)-binding protein [Chloroflexota bacterium]|nr:(Fe-S)-binding protein [Chloroflexota bacterium]